MSTAISHNHPDYAINRPVNVAAGRQKTSIYPVLGGLILFVAIISALVFSRQSLRLDEAQTLWQSSRTPNGIFYVVSQDVHVPLYHLLLHFWQFFLGNSVPAARMFSLLFFLASVPLTYLLGKTAFNRSVGLFAAALLAISPFLNWYGNEIRMYSLLMLLTVLNQYFFVRLFLQKDPRKIDANRQQTALWWGFGLSALVGVYTHYFFWLLLLAEAVFFFFYHREFAKKSFRKFAFVTVLLVCALVPWLVYVRHVNMISNAQPILARPTSVNFFNTFSQFLFGFQDNRLNTIIVSLWPLLVLFAFLSLRKNSKIPPAAVFFFSSVILPVIAAFIISILIKPLFLTRYLIFTVPALYLFLAWFLTIYPKKLARAFKIFLVAAMLLTLGIQARSSDTPVKEDFRSVSQYLGQNATAQDVIIMSAPFTIYPIEYYYTGPASLNTLPIWDRFTAGPIPVFSQTRMPAEVSQLKGEHRTAFLVLSYDQGYESDIKLYFDTHFLRLTEKNFSPGLDVYVYKLRYDNFTLNDILKANQPSAAP